MRVFVDMALLLSGALGFGADIIHSAGVVASPKIVPVGVFVNENAGIAAGAEHSYGLFVIIGAARILRFG